MPGSLTVRMANSYTAQVAWSQPNISAECRDVENYMILCSATELTYYYHYSYCSEELSTLVNSTIYSYNVISDYFDYCIYNCCVWASNSAGSGPRQCALGRLVVRSTQK